MQQPITAIPPIEGSARMFILSDFFVIFAATVSVKDTTLNARGSFMLTYKCYRNHYGIWERGAGNLNVGTVDVVDLLAHGYGELCF